MLRALVVVVVACRPSAEPPKPVVVQTPSDAGPATSILDHVDDLVVGLDHACALREGHVYCWGQALGLGASSHLARERVQLPDIRAISSSGRRVCAVGVGGELFCWGELVGERSASVPGQIYDVRAPEVQIQWGAPRRLELGHPITQVAVGMTHICALTDQHDLYCWGSANGKQLAFDTPMSAAELVDEHVDAVEAGHGWTCITSAGKRTCRGMHPEITGLSQLENAQTPGWVMAACGVSAGGEVLCKGELTLVYAGKRAPAEPTGEPVKIEGVAEVRTLALGSTHACVIRNDGSVWCWGDDQFGQISGRSGEANHAPIKIALPGPAKRIGAGMRHTCALLERGDVVCWGTGEAGGMFEPIRIAADPSGRNIPSVLAIATAQQRYSLRDKPTPTTLAGTTWLVCLTQVNVEPATSLCDVTKAYRVHFDERRFTAERGATKWTGVWKRTKDAIHVIEDPAPAGTRWEWNLQLHGEQLAGDRHVKGEPLSYIALGRKSDS